MRIAQVSPLHERVPPQKYGGTERVVSYLTEELVRRGHDVSLFASGDSETSARLVSACPAALRTDADCVDRLAHHVLQLEMVRRRSRAFDVVHYHIDYLHFPLSRGQAVPSLTTLHGRLDLPDLVPLYREFDDMPVVSISRAQRGPLPWIRWIGNVPHGLPDDLFGFRETAGDYLACLCRFSPEKGADAAVEIAGRAGLPIRLAGKVDSVDREYYRTTIEPLGELDHVRIVGEIGGSDKEELLGGARALLFPIDWPEPFGLTMIESLACGTPVIAFRRGSVPEVVEHGRTGFVVDSVSEAVEAVARIDEISRSACRREFERRFTVARMAEDYLDLYERLARAKPTRAGTRSTGSADGRETRRAAGRTVD